MEQDTKEKAIVEWLQTVDKPLAKKSEPKDKQKVNESEQDAGK